MDSLNKRIKIIQEIAGEIGLNNVTFRHGRAEELARDKEYRERFDLAVSRSCQPGGTVGVLPALCKGRRMVCRYKSGNAEEELAASLRAIELLGVSRSIISRSKLRDSIWITDSVIKKVKNTWRNTRENGNTCKEPLK
jgi:16S rRNA (guanine527-N7)-methyltransferase